MAGSRHLVKKREPGITAGVVAAASFLVAGIALLVLFPLTPPAEAEVVVPRNSVTSYVNIRASADGNSPALGRLSPGQHLTYSRSVPNWHLVVMPGGTDGFVSKRWTEVLPDFVNLSQEVVVHFLDVGTGDSAIIDMGDKEIVIDGGDSISVLDRYVRNTGVIQDPIELLVVTHGDTDHWNGLRRLLGFDGVVDQPFSIVEYWDPGYDRDCNPPRSRRPPQLSNVYRQRKGANSRLEISPAAVSQSRASVG